MALAEVSVRRTEPRRLRAFVRVALMDPTVERVNRPSASALALTSSSRGTGRPDPSKPRLPSAMRRQRPVISKGPSLGKTLPSARSIEAGPVDLHRPAGPASAPGLQKARAAFRVRLVDRDVVRDRSQPDRGVGVVSEGAPERHERSGLVEDAERRKREPALVESVSLRLSGA